MSYFDRKAVPQATQNELDGRFSENVNTWQGTPYVNLTSMCNKCKPEFQLSLTTQANEKIITDAENAVHTAKAKAIALGIDYIPLPDTSLFTSTVTELKVVKQGELGTSRKATVQIQCPTVADLAELQQCYFIPGMSVRIQWGYAKKGSTPAFPQPVELITSPQLNTDIVKTMINHTATAEGVNSEGMQGPVSNFGYTYNKDNGYWDCFIEVISAAQLVEGSSNKPNCIVPPCYVKIDNTETGGGKKTITLDIFEEELVAKANKGKNLSTAQMIGAAVVGVVVGVVFVAANVVTLGGASVVLAAAGTAAVGATVAAGVIVTYNAVTSDSSKTTAQSWSKVFQYEGDTRDPNNLGKADGGFWSSTMGTGANENYISLLKLTEIWNDKFAKGPPTIPFPTNFSTLAPQSFQVPQLSYGVLRPEQAPEPTPPAIIDITTSLIDYPKSNTGVFIGSSDARICFIPGGEGLDDLLDGYSANEVPSAIIGNKIQAGNIAVNTIHALQVYRTMRETPDDMGELGKVNSVEYFNKILNDINASCGSPWEYLRIHPNGDGILTIVSDRNENPDAIIPPYELKVGGDRAVLSDLKLELKLTGAMKTQALYGNNKSSIGKNNCIAAKFEPFGLSNNYFTDNGVPTPVPPPPCKESEIKLEAGCKTVPTTTKELFEEAGDGHTDGDCANLAERLSHIKDLLVDPVTGEPIIKAELKEACKNITLPFEMSFTLVGGVGGFGFGQIVTCNLVPESVRTKFEFQVLNAAHTVNVKGWTTEVTTVARATKPS